ncbi:MAG: glycoside hydrolase family 97 N-terminal domain-containing protein, partial [Sedimentisphaerales bacterium]|nr:glycoside hydrolase family 97 N-terminal domain-containing protein [Sedimentisphaerales bacterium]
MRLIWTSLAVSLVVFLQGHAVVAQIGLSDPCGLVNIQLELTGQARFSVAFKDLQIVKDCPISLSISDGPVVGKEVKVVDTSTKTIDQILYPEVPIKNARIRDLCNELTVQLADGYGLVFRAYPDAVAYRWTLSRPGQIKVANEELVLRFAQDHQIYFPEEESLLSHSERTYKYLRLSQIEAGRFCSLPALVDIQPGPKVAITEADLLDYPGMYLKGTGSKALEAMFPAVALRERQVDDRTVRVTQRADYIASTSGPRSLPWRVIIIAQEDKDLIENQTVYKLATPCRLTDTSWIRPGKVAWDWWNANNLYGVDFRAGVNTQTYKYYIDFAAKYGIEYIILDEGWYPLGNLLANAKDMDVEELFRYAKGKGVGIILWMTWKT